MSLDVSPDGKEIVFDLLGDLYTMPIGGGEAKALTSGIAWDMQPRYSPDGKWIAFTSDRSGGDNIWVVGRDGKDLKQVTKETFRLPNSPAWTPDSQYIAVRKHFTGTRSLGAGEIWLYHRSGGEGLQMTKRPTEQKDTGEPAFSPDGRYLYYSEDSSPGRIYQYNPDPNGQIYVIKRLDRQTGRLIDFVTGPGGSIRATPSPDGKSLAFVRRVRYKSTLFVKDVESGVERPIWNGLERDMQETWAVHGVYPGMAWTPDSKSVVLWAAGKIHRVDVASKQVANIPFHVTSDRKAATAVRFKVDVPSGQVIFGDGAEGTTPPAPNTFPVKMLRWVGVSPDGKRVAYTALGYVYVKDLPNGTPHRLTSRRTTGSSSPRGRATRSRSSTRPGTTSRSVRFESHPSPPASRASSPTSPATTRTPSSLPTARRSFIGRTRAASSSRARGPRSPVSTGCRQGDPETSPRSSPTTAAARNSASRPTASSS